MTALWLDLRYALRMMAKAPGLTAVLVITLALGIGASTTIFSVVHSVLIRPLPYAQPDQLARVYTEFHGKMSLERFWMSPPELDDLTRACRSCAAVGGWARGSASLSGGDRPVRIEAAYATHQVLPLLGVPPLLGRFYDASEDRPGADPTVIVLGYEIWQRAFGGDPSIIGRKIQLDAMPVTVIGVMPRGFDFLDREEAWVPARFKIEDGNRASHFVNAIARVAPGQSIATLQAELDALAQQWGKQDGPKYHAISTLKHPMIARPFQADLVGSLTTTLWLLQGAVLFVLLIAIVNVANLLLARAETRTREVAVRHALGANRLRLVRQFVTESLILGLVGGALGILVAVWAVDGVTALIPKSAPRASEITLDATAVAFAVACSVAAALLFGLAPIVHARRTDLHGALKDGSPRTTGSKSRLRVRRSLVIVEIALAVVLVLGCTVMVRSFVKLQRVELGFAPDHALTFGVELPRKTYPDATGDAFWQRAQERLRALPSVTGVAMLDGMLPARPVNADDFAIPGRPQPTRESTEPPWNVDYEQLVNGGGLTVLGARFVAGRDLADTDTATSPAVAVVNQSFAAKYFPGQDPIGKQIQLGFNADPTKIPNQTIVGVVADLKNAGIDQPAGTEVWAAYAQYASQVADQLHSDTSAYFILRASGDPAALIASVQHAFSELDPSLPLFQMRTFDDLMWEAVARPRFLTFLLTSFAALALLLGAVGIYGVMAHTVAQRTHEIGLRVALGARPAQVRAMVLRQAGVLVAAGVGAGLAIAIGVEQLLSPSLTTLFYGERLSQPSLLAGVAVAVVGTALLATWIPARRATRVHPMVALRSE